MAKRRRYQFKDRAEAEEKYREAERKRLYQLRLARALYAQTVHWLYNGKVYRFGVFDQNTPCGPKVVMVFSPNTGQQPDLQVFDPDSSELQELEQSALHYNDKDSPAILRGVQAVRNELQRTPANA
jgi:hypothetical protein